jgi:heme A synthase
MLAGGHKAISGEADAIIRDAMNAEPGRLLAATWNNTLQQLIRFDSGDGLESWNGPAGSWIDKDFPVHERDAFHAARQQLGTLAVSPLLVLAHRIAALAGIAAALVLLPIAWHRRHVAAWYLVVALLALPLSAAITGGLSAPHERYQSRVVWLPACIALLSVAALAWRPRRANA